MERLVTDQRVCAVFMKNYYLPFCNEYDLKWCKNVIMDPGILDERIEKDTKVLAMKMSGKCPSS